MKLERWKPAPGLPDQYQISDCGRLRTIPYIDARGWKRRTRILKAPRAEFSVLIDGKRYWFAIAALVLRAFFGPPPKGKYLARHLDDTRSNNNLSNLAWGDDQDNHDDAILNGVSYISRGHLGHRHSKQAKVLIGAAAKGRHISVAHKIALRKGYNRWQRELH